MKKTLCLILVIAAAMLTFGGLTAFADEEKINLVWFTEQMDDVEVERTMKYIIEPFEEKYPNIHIELSPTADYEQVLKVQLSAKGGPDICNMGGPTITAEFVSANKILDLTSYVEECGMDKQMFTWALDSCRVNGSIYSLPNSYEALMLWINNDMFAEKGWTVPTNWEEMQAFCEAAMNEGIIPMAFGTSDFTAINEQFVSIAFACYAGRDNVVKALKGELPWTDQIFVDSINCLKDMWQKGWISDKNSHAISDNDASALWYSGMAATRMTGTWAISDFSRNVPFSYSAVAFPAMNDEVTAAVPIGAGGCVAINADTKSPDECFAFLKFMFTENAENQALAVAEGAQPLPVESDPSLYPEDMDSVYVDVLDMLDDCMENIEQCGHVMWSYWPAETRLFMMDNIEKVYLGEMTTEEYLEQSNELFVKELEAGLVPAV